MVEQLRSRDVDVDVFENIPLTVKPDAIFLNNWFTTHSDGINNSLSNVSRKSAS